MAVIVHSNATLVKSSFEEQEAPSLQAGPYDVLCNRSRAAFNHVGNRRFRILVENYAASYSKIVTKTERSVMVEDIVKTIQCAGGNFMRKSKDGNSWQLCTKVQAKEKVGHALRGAVSCARKGEHTPRSIYEILRGVESNKTVVSRISNKKRTGSLSLQKGNSSLSQSPHMSIVSAMATKLQVDSMRAQKPDQQLSAPSVMSESPIDMTGGIDLFEDMVFSLDPENDTGDHTTEANKMISLFNVLDDIDDFGSLEADFISTSPFLLGDEQL